MGDRVIVGLVVVAFALWVTVHITLAFGLGRRVSIGRGFAALVVVPLAPYWGFRERMWIRGGLWGLSAVTYVVALLLAYK
jgi:hypothetical protein